MSVHDCPLVLRVPPAFVRGACSFDQVIARAQLFSRAWRYAMCPAEARFARALARRHPALWLYRTDQQALAGDFLVVDMSEPQPARRRLWAVEVKLGAEIRVGGGGASNQLCRVDRAVLALSRLGVVGSYGLEARPVLVCGDGEAVTQWLSDHRRRRC